MIRRIPRGALDGEARRVQLLEPAPVPGVQPGARTESADARRARLEALLYDELALAPERVVALCRRELERLGACGEVTVHAHPDDRALLERAFSDAPEISITSDATVRRGGARLTCANGEIDARVETRIGRMLALLGEEGP